MKHLSTFLSSALCLVLSLVLASSCSMFGGKNTCACRCGDTCKCVSGYECGDTACIGSRAELSDGIYLINGHRFVDLALPSGLLWAEANVGATSPADAGDYFAWGETAPKDNYTWETYKFGAVEVNEYGVPVRNHFTKYNKAEGTVLDKDDDAAYANWGKHCRMPLADDFNELLNGDYVEAAWTTQTNSQGKTIHGLLIKSKKNGNSIFLPAVGLKDSTALTAPDVRGAYWTSSLDASENADVARYLSFYSGSCHVYNFSRCVGYSVRAVARP